MAKQKDDLREFVEGLELTVLKEEDAVLLEGMVGTSGTGTNNCKCGLFSSDNCQCHGSNNCKCGFFSTLNNVKLLARHGVPVRLRINSTNENINSLECITADFSDLNEDILKHIYISTFTLFGRRGTNIYWKRKCQV